jgi:hypothetical protein
LAPALKLKRTNSKKVTKNLGALDLKHHEAMSCGEKEVEANMPDRIYSGAVSLGTIAPE